MNLPIVLNRDSHVIEPWVHDADIEALAFGDSRVTLTLRNERGQRFAVQMADVLLMSGDGLRERNVVYDIEVTRGVAPNRQTLEELVSAASEGGSNDGLIDELCAEVLGGRKVLVVLEPVLGANLIAICTELTARRLETAS